MPWLRVDDGFTQHPKVVKLSRGDRWTWLEVLCYCARYRTKGIVTETIAQVVRGATPAFLRRCHELRLLDRVDDEYRVHDWTLYNAETIGEKVGAYLAQFPDASGNDVHRALGGKREIVLHEVAEQRFPTGSLSGTPEVPNQSTPPVPLVRAREPVPNPSKSFTGGSPTSDVDPPLAKELTDALAVAKLLEVVGDVDEDGLAKIRGFAARLPEGSLHKVAESLRIQRPTNRVGYAIAALSSELRESVA